MPAMPGGYARPSSVLQGRVLGRPAGPRRRRAAMRDARRRPSGPFGATGSGTSWKGANAPICITVSTGADTVTRDQNTASDRTLELVRAPPGDRPRGHHPDRYRAGGGLPRGGQRLPGRIADRPTVAALPRAPRSRPESARIGGGVPGARGGGIQQRCAAPPHSWPGRKRRQTREQVLQRPRTPPHHSRATPTSRRTWRPAWLPSSPHRTPSVRSWPAGRRRHRPRTWPRSRRRPRRSLDATLASLQDTISDSSRSQRRTRRMRPPAVPETSSCGPSSSAWPSQAP